MRGRRIYPMMVWQSLAQMKERYGDAWEDMLSQCDTQIYLGVNDQFTKEYVSKALGKTTIRTQGVSSQHKKSFMDSD
ncbi:TraM recognition domain-containing protein, partial [Rothia aeria]|uniref:TraM recognition domain-containing protein n=1 Tax=Rothia aeria TaxID=172042 RepID=UPI00244AE98D